MTDPIADFFHNLGQVLKDRELAYCHRITVTVYEPETQSSETIDSDYDPFNKCYFVKTKSGRQFVGGTTAELFEVVNRWNKHHAQKNNCEDFTDDGSI